MRKVITLAAALITIIGTASAQAQQDTAKSLTQQQIQDKLILSYARAFTTWEFLAATKDASESSFIDEAKPLIVVGKYTDYIKKNYNLISRDVAMMSGSLQKNSANNSWAGSLLNELDGCQKLLREVITKLETERSKLSTSYEKAKVDEEGGDPQYIHWALTQMDSLLKDLKEIDFQGLNTKASTIVTKTAE